MKNSLFAVLLTVCSAFAIGDQHGTFASRSTQGTMWQGYSSIVAENYRITVMPAYLDIEVDWEFNVGGMKPDSFTNALEIVGNISLAQGSSVIGMLLWNGDSILKARLKPILAAREQYEQVVDRNAPVAPRPRDPVIFEYGFAKDNYDISIFPVSWNGTRKLRMRYLVPAVNLNGMARIPYPYALSPNVASITILRGPGVDSFALESYNYLSKTVGTDSISFNCYSDTYRSTSLVRPVVSAAQGKSVIYTAAFETMGFKGVMSQVVGLPARQIIQKAGIKEDIVILWRWNHPEVIKYYAAQIVKQAGVLKAFCDALDKNNKRAAMIVDIQGGERLIFDLGAKGSGSFTRMTHFLDSLQTQEIPAVSGGTRPNYSQQAIDSIVAQSTAEFNKSVALAISLFDSRSPVMRSILVVTAGPRWITNTTQNIITVLENGVVIKPLYAAIPVDISAGIDLASVRDLYWPGMNINSITNSNPQYTVSAEITNGSVRKTFSLGQGSQTIPTFRWGYVSPDLDLKLYSMGMIKPNISWKVYSGSTVVATYEESPVMVPLFDGMQWARALAGTKQLQALEGTLPASLAATFGFVDEQYALLALEEDVMQQADQERYRITGVPTLAWNEIEVDTQNVVSTDISSPNQSTAVSPDQQKRVQQNSEVRVSLSGSMLVLDLGDQLRYQGKEIRIQVYTVSGRLLATIVIPAGNARIVQALLPASVLKNRETLVLHISIGGQMIVKKLVVR